MVVAQGGAMGQEAIDELPIEPTLKDAQLDGNITIILLAGAWAFAPWPFTLRRSLVANWLHAAPGRLLLVACASRHRDDQPAAQGCLSQRQIPNSVSVFIQFAWRL